MTAALQTIRTQIPARMDRLPWSRFHWRIVAGLGTVWILDGLEVTIVGAIGARLAESGSRSGMTVADIGTAGAVYVAGACLGALLFGQLTDRFGRKRLMMLTLAVYIVATVLTAFAFNPIYFFLCRFFTGAGIGGEYAAINSAIDELIPARNRGQVDITINGSYWVGSGIGGLAGLLFLDQSIFAASFGWRLAFAIGALLGLGILLVRRSVPESPRWLLIHGHEQEAEEIVSGLEREVRDETGQDLPAPSSTIAIRQRASIPFMEIARVALTYYPQRAILGLALFIGQAFLYNAVTFNLGTMLSGFFHVSSGAVPAFMVVFAAGNFLGPLVLGRLFDTIGRKPMISATYLISAALTVVLAVLLTGGALSERSFILLVALTFFFASAGASSAYLTVSEIFPMETRALAIAFFYAIGTAVGGIIGPLMFGQLIAGGESSVALGFYVGAAVMAVGGIAELIFGVKAEGAALEDIATPLTVADAEAAGESPTDVREAGTAASRATAATSAPAMAAGAAGAGPAAGAMGPPAADTAAKTAETPETPEQMRERIAQRQAWERTGARRFRPGPGEVLYSPGMLGTSVRSHRNTGEYLDHEVEMIEHAVLDRGPVTRAELAALVGAHFWGPGRFRRATIVASREGRIARLADGRYVHPELAEAAHVGGGAGRSAPDETDEPDEGETGGAAGAS